MEKYRAVFHLDEGNKGRVDMALNNIDNLLADLGENNVAVELVTNGGGIVALFKADNNPHADRLARLAARGVRFAACAHTLHSKGLTRDALLDAVQVVPSGVGELVKRQTDGWAYIRP